jgi:cytochrome c oxidase assembly protein subunit 15
MKEKLNAYQKVAIATVIITVVLIMIGSLVRAAGAGLGCPDWPKCFGMWIPPSTIAELPSQFDASLFNPTLMWIEYVNRLFGVLTGFFILLTFAFSFSYRKTNPKVFWASTASFILVLFQGWLGGQVVASELHAVLISAHMIVAILILAVLVYAVFESLKVRLKLIIDESVRNRLFQLSLVLFVVVIAQILLGTQVREAVDIVKQTMPELTREGVVENLGIFDHIHRAFSWIVAGSLGAIWYVHLKKDPFPRVFVRLNQLITLFAFLQAGIGIVLVYGGLPPAFQVLHLIGATLLVTTILVQLFYLHSLRVNSES